MKPLMTLVQLLYQHCAAFERAEDKFSQQQAPEWWPTESAPFKHISSMNKKQLEALFLAMLAQAAEVEGLLSDMQMQLHQLRNKYASFSADTTIFRLFEDCCAAGCSFSRPEVSLL